MYVTVDAMLKKFGERELVQLTDNEAPYQDVINYDKLDAAIEEARILRRENDDLKNFLRDKKLIDENDEVIVE